MIRLRTMLLAAALLTATAVPALAHPHPGDRMDARQRTQHRRIVDGWRRGDLNRFEARRLAAGQRRLERMKLRAKRDGRFGLRERMHFRRMLQRENRMIHRFRHNRHGRLI